MMRGTTMRYFLQLAYKGTKYHGWQVQPNALTVQAVLEDRLTLVLQKKVKISGSSRTDAGVHAHQQWAHVDLTVAMDVAKLRHQLNVVLPPDITILGIYPVVAEAHARFSALARTYQYRILTHKNAFLYETAYTLPAKLNIDAMNQAAAILLHKTDFTSLSKIGSAVHHHQCSIMEAQWVNTAHDQLIFYIQANRFLRGMVRSIVSNLIQVGLGKTSIASWAALIDAKDRSLGASLVPACGLTLSKVTYPQHIFIN